MAKELWLSALAAFMLVVPMHGALAQGTQAAPAAQADGDDDDDADAAAADDDDDSAGAASHRGAMVPPASGLTIPPGSELMPASALNGNQIGLPPVSLSSQIVTPLVIGSAEDPYAVSARDFYLRAGQAYRWDMVSEGDVEYKLHAPDFFRNVWMNQIVIADREIHMAGPPAWLEYDAKGPITVQFQTIRPGRYDWYVEGLEGDREMRGTITVVP
jgi:hypothetical protein